MSTAGVKRWRLIVDDRLPGAVNMAVDRAIQIVRDTGDCPPTLRLYGWERPTVSLGRFQDERSVDFAACGNAGVDVVRRFTGGRGVLHDAELTYSVVASMSDGIPRGTAASYRLLSGALAAAYRRLGAAAEIAPREGGVRGSAACYLHATAADLSRDGRKLSGSAQVWLRETVMQHGSFVIERDPDLEASVFRLGDAEKVRLAEETQTLAEALHRVPAVPEVIEAVIDGFEAALGIRLEPGELGLEEQRMAEHLRPGVLVSGNEA